MKLQYKENTIFIADDSEKAKLIQAGHNFHLDEKDNLIIDPIGTNLTTKYQIAIALQKTTTISDLRNIIVKILEMI